MAQFYLIRHGETDWNRKGLYTGQSDIPLNNNGRMQAQQTATDLQKLQPSIIYSSDLQRAVETAQIISQTLHVPIFLDNRLREIHQGEWEGLHEMEIKTRFEEEFRSRLEDPLSVAPPGGETIGDVLVRVSGAVKDMLKQHPTKKITVVAHGVVLAMMILIAKEIPVSRVFEFVPKNAIITHVDIERIND